MERDPIFYSRQDSRLETGEMTRKTKCKLLFFSIWPGVQCSARFIENSVYKYAPRWHLQLFSYILFAHCKRHSDTSSLSRNLSCRLRTERNIVRRNRVKNLMFCVAKTFLSFRDFLIICMFNILCHTSTHYILYSGMCAQLKMSENLNE